MPNDLIVFALGVLAGFFAIMNPVANTPIVLGLTEGIDDRDKRRIAKRSTLVAFLIVAVFSVVADSLNDPGDLL